MPNTLQRQVVALASIISWGNLRSLSQHPRICSFIRGAKNIWPPVIHCYPTWELEKVLSALTTGPFKPLRTTSLHFLTYKVVFLLAIASARRILELAALSVRKGLCIFHHDRVVLCPDPTFMPKINSVFHRAQELILPNFCS
uniref:Uncharacterized protein n=1 Tax=Micrurus lemniscatus lemniscatus TaxID=129467 RepID=A0A2D4JIJ3_MICLE